VWVTRSCGSVIFHFLSPEATLGGRVSFRLWVSLLCGTTVGDAMGDRGQPIMAGTKTPDSSGKPADRRKLVAVVYADMVGYSRLIGLDDAGTLQRLRTLRREVIDPAISEHSGRLVQTGGDSLLIVFDSIDGAVRCALKVQQQVVTHDADHAPDRAIRFRIGVNLGDAIADGTDLHGDVVNVAARLQAECPPGGICVSRQVQDHVQDRLGLSFQEPGPLNLKNIARPVEAFLVKPNVNGGQLQAVVRSLVRGSGVPLPLPDKPSIAVLAFTNMSGDLEQEYFSDGISNDIITELSRRRSLFVIARNSSFTYKGRAVDVKQVADELGVRYVVEGSVRRSDSRVRITAQLIDAETGNHIWAERYDRDVLGVFAIQDEITVAVTTAILPALMDAEQRRALRKPPESLGAWEAYQRGLWHLGRYSAADNIKAQHFLERAVALDAGFASAHTYLAGFSMSRVLSGVLAFDEGLRLAGKHAREAGAFDPDDAEGQAVAAGLRIIAGQGERALEALLPALMHNPNSVWANAAKGIALVSIGKRSDGRAALLTALRLDPREPGNGLFAGWVAISYYYECDYTFALETANTVIGRYPDYAVMYRWLAATLGQLGQYHKAHEAMQRAIEVSPKSFELSVRSRPPWFRPEDHGHFLDGLRKAGWQG
jgi:adenylate cyclase